MLIQVTFFCCCCWAFFVIVRQSKFAVSVGTAQQYRGHTKHAMQNYNIRAKIMNMQNIVQYSTEYYK